MYLDEIPKYRDTIIRQILKSETILSHIGTEDSFGASGSGVVYKSLYPYGHIINKTSKAGNYLCFDIVAPRIVNRAFVDLRICFWVISHDRWIRTPNGLVTDILSNEIERIMNGSKDFGLGKVELICWERFNPTDEFHGRSLVYRTVDFNRE